MLEIVTQEVSMLLLDGIKRDFENRIRCERSLELFSKIPNMFSFWCTTNSTFSIVSFEMIKYTPTELLTWEKKFWILYEFLYVMNYYECEDNCSEILHLDSRQKWEEGFVNNLTPPLQKAAHLAFTPSAEIAWYIQQHKSIRCVRVGGGAGVTALNKNMARCLCLTCSKRQRRRRI